MRANVVGRNRPAFLLRRQKTPTGLSTREVSGSLETTDIEISLEILEKWFPPFSHLVNALNMAQGQDDRSATKRSKLSRFLAVTSFSEPLLISCQDQGADSSDGFSH